LSDLSAASPRSCGLTAAGAAAVFVLFKRNPLPQTAARRLGERFRA
jgi:hypothetical protein